MLRNERILLISDASAILFLLYAKQWMGKLGDPLWFAGMSIGLFGVIFFASVAAPTSGGLPADSMGGTRHIRCDQGVYRPGVPASRTGWATA
jgi:hypothetical protein